MRFLKRIGFFLYSCMVFGAGFWLHGQGTALFYADNRPGSMLAKDLGGCLDHMVYPQQQKSGEQGKEETLPAARSQNLTTCDTILITRIYNSQEKEVDRIETRIPAKYIGMDRENFVHMLESDMRSPTLAERRQGFVSAEVLSFSPRRIVIRKKYRPIEQPAVFFVQVAENRVMVYREDRRTLWQKTGIDARLLPAGLREELMQGKTITGQANLDKFLESLAGS